MEARKFSRRDFLVGCSGNVPVQPPKGTIWDHLGDVGCFHDGYDTGFFGREPALMIMKKLGVRDWLGPVCSFYTWKYNYREEEGKKLSHRKDFGTFITEMDIQSKVVNSLIALIGHTEINNTEFMPFKYLK